jgi:hypothetical protein
MEFLYQLGYKTIYFLYFSRYIYKSLKFKQLRIKLFCYYLLGYLIRGKQKTMIG